MSIFDYTSVISPMLMVEAHAYLLTKWKKKAIRIFGRDGKMENEIMCEVSEAILDNSEYGINPDKPVSNYHYIEIKRMDRNEDDVSLNQYAFSQIQVALFKLNGAYFKVEFKKFNGEDASISCKVDIFLDEDTFLDEVSYAKKQDTGCTDRFLWQ